MANDDLKDDWGHPEDHDEHFQKLEIEIYLPDAEPDKETKQLERIQNAVGAFLEVNGFTADPTEKGMTLYSSWHWYEWFKSKNPLVKRESQEIYEGIKEALKRQQIDKAGAEAFDLRAKATAELLASLEPYDNAIVRMGDVVIAKAKIDGAARVVVETLSPEMARELEANPILLKNAEAFFHFVDAKATQYLEEVIRTKPK